jgi:hypothetical protein
MISIIIIDESKLEVKRLQKQVIYTTSIITVSFEQKTIDLYVHLDI